MFGSRVGIFANKNTSDGLILWLDATDTTTMFSDTGGTTAIVANAAVRRWNSKTANGIYLTENTGNAVYQTNQLNSYAAVRCNGANGTYSILRPFGSITGATMIMVMKYDYKTDSSNGAFVQFDTADASRTYYNNKISYENFGYDTRQTITDDSWVTYSIIAIRADSVSNTTKVYKNNITSEIFSSTYGTAWLNYNLRFGSTTAASKPVYGNISELYLYKSALSIADLTSKLSDLRTKYGFTIPNYLYNWDASVAASLRNSSGNQATNGQVVTAWQEKNGSATVSNFVAPSTTYGPIYNSSGSYLDFSNFRQLYIDRTNNTTQMYNKTFIFVITTSALTTPEMVLLSKGKWDTGFSLMAYGKIELYFKTINTTSGTVIPANTKMVIAYVFPNVTGMFPRLFKNAAVIQIGTNTITAASTTDVMDLILASDGNGTSVITPNDTSNYTFKGKIHEFIMYNTALYNDAVNSIMQTLMTKWSIS